MYDALIIANGEIAPQPLWQDLTYRTLICTDGAALSLKHLGVNPDIIIGDMDSITDDTLFASITAYEKEFPHSTLLVDAEQETTDFEKALNFSVKQKFSAIFCTGILGKAADHSMHNIGLLSRYSQHFKIMALSTFDNIRQWIFPLPEKAIIYTQAGASVSFIPFPEATLSTKGLQWDLKAGILSQNGPYGVRNKSLTPEVTIHCTGHCLCFISAPFMPHIEPLV